MGLIQPMQSKGTGILTARHIYVVAVLIVCAQLCGMVGASNPTKKQSIRRRRSRRAGKPSIRNLFREIDSDLVASSTVVSAIGVEDLESNGPGTTVTEDNDEDNGNEGDDDEDDSENEGPTPSEPGPTPPATPQPGASEPEATPPPTPQPGASEPEPTPPPTPQPGASEPEPTPPPTPQPDVSEPEPTPPPTPQPDVSEPEPTPPPSPQPHASEPEPTPSPILIVTRRPTNQPTSSSGESKDPTHAPIVPAMTPDPTPAPVTAKATDTPTPAPVIQQTTPLPSPAPAVSRRPTVAPTSISTTAAPISDAPIANAPTTSAPATKAPTDRPTKRPTNRPTRRPTKKPTNAPTSVIPSYAPSEATFTGDPTRLSATNAPTFAPTKNPTDKPINSPSRNPISTPSGAPTLPNRVPLESLEAPITATPSPTKLKASAPTLLPSTTQEPTTNKPTRYSFSFSREDMERLDSMNGSVNLRFSLLFPNSKIRNMNITKVENAVLSSLEHLYCDPRRREDVRDDHCLLKSDLINMDSIDGAIQQRQQDGSDPNYSILGIPYVTHLDERYAHDDERISWTTWKISWDIIQFGTPLLESAILPIDPETSLSLQEVFMAGVQAMQEIVETAMDVSIRSGNFDAVLDNQGNGILVQSSAINKEMETFKFTASDFTFDGSEKKSEEGSSSDRNLALIVVFIVLAIFAIGCLVAYFTLKPRSPKTDWKREREQKIIDSIEHEAALERESPTVPHTVKISAGSKQVGSISTASKLMGSIDASKGQTTAQLDSLLSLDNGSKQMRSIDGSKGQENSHVDFLSLDNDDALPFSAANVIHNLEDKLYEPDDQGSAISSLDYNWSVEGVDTPWKAWPINKRAPYLQDAPSLEDSPNLEKVPGPVEKVELAITRGPNDTIDV